MRTNTPFPVDPEIDKDYYGVRSGGAASTAEQD
jgi:hypothetical protein